MFNGTLTFSAEERRHCINVSIVNDGVFEGVETFEAKLINNAEFVTLDPATATISIVDDDGKSLYSFVFFAFKTHFIIYKCSSIINYHLDMLYYENASLRNY